MQKLTERLLRLAPPGGLFDLTVVQNLFPDATVGARRLLLHRALVQGEVRRLTRGLYWLAEPFSSGRPHPFALAVLLCFPSHVSFESALAFHGLIPEAVYGVSSATSRRSREYQTPLGQFTFVRVPASAPAAGVRALRLDRQWWGFVASPVRAIADLLYVRREVTWKKDGIAFLTDSMRIDREDLESMTRGAIDEVRAGFRNRRVRDYLSGLQEALGA